MASPVLGTRCMREIGIGCSLSIPSVSAASSVAVRGRSASSVSHGWRQRRSDVSIRLASTFFGVVVPVISHSSVFYPRPAAPRRLPLSPVSQLVQKVTADQLDSILTHERTSPMIIDFYATWCGPCVILAQQLEQLAVEYGGDIRFLKVDTDEEHELAAQMEIRGLPTMVFVSKDVDKLAIRTEGLLPVNTIREIIEKEIMV